MADQKTHTAEAPLNARRTEDIKTLTFITGIFRKLAGDALAIEYTTIDLPPGAKLVETKTKDFLIPRA